MKENAKRAIYFLLAFVTAIQIALVFSFCFLKGVIYKLPYFSMIEDLYNATFFTVPINFIYRRGEVSAPIAVIFIVLSLIFFVANVYIARKVKSIWTYTMSFALFNAAIFLVHFYALADLLFNYSIMSAALLRALEFLLVLSFYATMLLVLNRKPHQTQNIA